MSIYDTPVSSRTEEGLGDSFSTGDVSCPTQCENVVVDSQVSQDSAGAASLPSPPTTTHALSPPVSVSPQLCSFTPPHDYLERSYRSPSPFVGIPTDSTSPFLCDGDEHEIPMTDDDPSIGEDPILWPHGTRTPRFGDLSSPLGGSPEPLYNPPSPTLSFLIEDFTERRSKRKFEETEDEESSQYSTSSSVSRQQVEDQLTQSLEYNEVEEEAEPNSGESLDPNDMLSNFTTSSPWPPSQISKAASGSVSEQNLSVQNKRFLYEKARKPQSQQRSASRNLHGEQVSTFTLPYPNVQVSCQQSWYMPPNLKRKKSRLRSSGSERSSVLHSPTTPVAAHANQDHASLCQSQLQSYPNVEHTYPLMSQAPYDSQTYYR
ncbi:hypothetical protein L218DRAFT_984342 [Marasmius fiardii PR-910]|nr:hypothetical protein L218DRAFT_984342 [Marasmius fiardii PR-910]